MADDSKRNDGARTPAREPSKVGAAVDPDVFRDALAHWASGVALVAVRDPDGGRVYATTVTSFMSVSLQPPLVLVGLGASAQVLPFLAQDAAFGVSMLAGTQKRLATVFADSFPIGPSPFGSEDTLGADHSSESASSQGPAWSTAPTIANALYALECVVHQSIQAGDHLLVIGRVLDARAGPNATPLVRYRRGYRTLERA